MLKKKTIDFVFREIETLKTDMRSVKTTNENNVKMLSEVEMKIDEAERHQQRWNLGLCGIPEDKEENIKAKVTDICYAVVGESQGKRIREDIDIVHRRE